MLGILVEYRNSVFHRANRGGDGGVGFLVECLWRWSSGAPWTASRRGRREPRGDLLGRGKSWAAGVGSGTVGTQERQVYLLSFYGCDKCSARVAIGRSGTGDSGGAEPSLGGRGWSLADTQGCPFELYGGRRVGGGTRQLLSLCRVAVLLETVALSGTAGFWDVFGGGLLLDPQPAWQIPIQMVCPKDRVQRYYVSA